MTRTTIGLLAGASLLVLLPGAQFVYARGCGGAHPSGGYHSSGSGGSRGYSGGESRGGYPGGESRGEHPGGTQQGGEHSGAEGAPAGAAATNRNNPQHSGEQGAAAANRNNPQYSGAQGAAAGAAASNRNNPQYSGAQGAAAGAAAANRNSPQYSGAQGAAAGAAVANRNAPQYSGAQGAAAGYAAANANAPQYSGAQGAAIGYAAGSAYAPPVSSAYVALPTDAGYGVTATAAGPAPGAAPAVYAGNHQTEAVSDNLAAARGASVRTVYSGAGLYSPSWRAANPGAWTPAGWTAGQVWGVATWPTVGATLGWSGVQPIAYNYGTSITYQGGQVCYNNQPIATADEYYQQASALAGSASAPASSSDEWLPLGVFALVQKEQSDPHYVMQMAVNKAGTLAGNYSDLISGTTVPIQGAVDPKSQRVAWTVGNNKNTVGETGLYNLTKDEAPALIHVGKDKTQQWLLVRLKQPGAQP